jgi:hypothetical protein
MFAGFHAFHHNLRELHKIKSAASFNGAVLFVFVENEQP